MRQLLFLSSFVVFLFASSSVAQILQRNQYGMSHIDPILNEGNIFLEGVSSPEQVGFTWRCPSANNFFTFLESRTDGQGRVVSQTRHQVRLEAGTCDSLVNQAPPNTRRTNCHGFLALELQFSTRNPSTTGGQNFPVNLNTISRDGESLNLRQQANQCFCQGQSPCNSQRAPVVLHSQQSRTNGAQGEHIPADLNNPSLCTVPPRRIHVPNATWGDGQFDSEVSVGVSELFVGSRTHGLSGDRPHTRYFYNHESQRWNYHYAPRSEMTEPSYDPDNTLNRAKSFQSMRRGALDMPAAQGFTFPMSFFENADNQRVDHYPAAVSLRNPDNGPPYALVASLNSSYTGGPIDPDQHFDWTRPVLKMTVHNEPERHTVYETYLNGELQRRMNMSASYVLGSDVDNPARCEPESCLSYDPEMNATQYAEQRLTNGLLCTARINRDRAIPLGADNNTPDLCYSCNGLSSGTCGNPARVSGQELEKVILSSRTNPSTHERDVTSIRTAIQQCQAPLTSRDMRIAPELQPGAVGQ